MKRSITSFAEISRAELRCIVMPQKTGTDQPFSEFYGLFLVSMNYDSNILKQLGKQNYQTLILLKGQKSNE